MLTITQLIAVYAQCIFTFLFATIFNLDTQERQLIAKLPLSPRKSIRVIFPLFKFAKFLLASIQRA